MIRRDRHSALELFVSPWLLLVVCLVDVVQAQDVPAARGAARRAAAGRLEDPAVRSIRESNPQTPAELTRAVELLLGLGYPDQANQYLQRLLAAQLNPQAMVQLHNKVGSGMLLRLALDERLDEEGRQLAQKVIATAEQYARQPDRMRQMVRQLNDPDALTRSRALADLLTLEEKAVPALLAALGEQKLAQHHGAYRAVLVRLGPAIVEQLIGALASPDVALRTHVIRVLGQLQAASALPYLLRPYVAAESPQERAAAAAALQAIAGSLPTPAEAQQVLQDKVRSYLAGVPPRRRDQQGLIELWGWSDQSRYSVPLRFSAHDASIMSAARLASDLRRLRPDEPRYQQLDLLANLEANKSIQGLDRPLPRGPGTAHQLSQAVGPQVVEQVLELAMREEHLPAAIGAAELLGDAGDVRLLAGDAGQLRPLVQALAYPDRRLQLAAAAAIMKLEPPAAYAGSSLLPHVLGYWATATGTRRAVVGHGSAEMGHALAGMLRGLGFEVELATTARQVLKLAADSPDVEFVLLDRSLPEPGALEAVQRLRLHPRTATLPVALLTDEEGLDVARRRAAEHPATVALVAPQTRDGVAFVTRRTLALAGRRAIEPEQRVLYANAALGWLSQLAQHSDAYPFYDLVGQRHLLLRAATGSRGNTQAVSALGWLATPDAQLALVELASQHARPLAVRQAAAAAFDQAVRRRGLLLTTRQIVTQYDRYNQSAMLNKETQQVLAAILDSIESPTAQEK